MSSSAFSARRASRRAWRATPKRPWRSSSARSSVACSRTRTCPASTGLRSSAACVSRSRICACILMTAYATTESAVEALRLGAVDYIAKPFDDLDRIAARIDDALRQMKAQYERRSAAPQLRLVGSEAANDPPDDEVAAAGHEQATPLEVLQARVRHATSDLRRRSLHLLSRLVASKAAGREVLLSGEALLDDLRHIRGAGGADRGELRRIEEK